MVIYPGNSKNPGEKQYFSRESSFQEKERTCQTIGHIFTSLIHFMNYQLWKFIISILVINLQFLTFVQSEQYEDTVNEAKLPSSATQSESSNLTIAFSNEIITSERPIDVDDNNYTAKNLPSVHVTATESSNEISKDKCDIPGRSGSEDISKYVLLYILIFVYSFLGITVTCHRYFVTSLSRICDDFKLSEDIVGATFMAAGSSAPELTTVIISVFSAKNDIGISEVIGSAVFNLIFVIALCGLITKTALQLNWWPLVRNCFFYTISIFLMLIAIYDGHVSWLGSLILIGAYILYLVALYYNEFLEAWANTLPFSFIESHKSDDEEVDANYIPLEDRKVSTYSSTSPERSSIVQSNGKVISSIQQTYQSNKLIDENNEIEGNDHGVAGRSGVLEQMKFYFINPVHHVCRWTIPDWQNERFHNLYFLTFFVSFLWIAVYSYIMIWMITLIGIILTIPNTVMGLTLIAAGNSVPDAVTSLKVIGKGCADMAVSNAIGSNIFDILICLGLPWFLQTAVIRSESYVKVCSKGMVYSTMMLLATVIMLIYSINKNGWKLDKKIGTILMVGYFMFISIAVLWEIFMSSS